jgi:hypothetical protein
MLNDIIYQWNPFNIYGKEVDVEDLIYYPLQPSETLMQDGYGRCRRLKIPSLQSTFWEKAIFWFQTHLNEKGHLEAINQLISLFYQNLLQYPPQETEKLQEYQSRIHQLRSLKNDYGFVHVKTTDSSFIDSRLKEIEQHAYSIFTYYYQLQGIEQEEERKKDFFRFEEQMKQSLQDLKSKHFAGLLRLRLLILAPLDILRFLVEEIIQSIRTRLQVVENLYQQISEIERQHEGKFTIPYLDNDLKEIKVKLSNEIGKIDIEAEILIRNLILNYRLSPFKEEVKVLLDALKIDPEELRPERAPTCLFREALKTEIKRIRQIFKEWL